MRYYTVSSARPDGTPCYWSNVYGWCVCQQSATLFSAPGLARKMLNIIMAQPLVYDVYTELCLPPALTVSAVDVDYLPPASPPTETTRPPA